MSMGYRVSTEECLRLFSSFWRWRSYAPLPKFGLETRPAFESLDIACWLCHLPAGQTKYLGLPSDNWSDHESLSMVSLQLSFLLSVPKARFGQGYFKEGNPVTTFPTWLITEFTWKGFFLKKKKMHIPYSIFHSNSAHRRWSHGIYFWKVPQVILLPNLGSRWWCPGPHVSGKAIAHRSRKFSKTYEGLVHGPWGQLATRKITVMWAHTGQLPDSQGNGMAKESLPPGTWGSSCHLN